MGEVEGMFKWSRLMQIFTMVAAIAMMGEAPTFAATHTGHSRRSHHHHSRRASGPVTMYHAALLEDADTGRVLYANNPNLTWPPASMAKMMLLLGANDQIAAG